ncbi:hypothetical protein ACIU1J_01960 [Azospirillum doebereinerae]|uniref:hypothetical protein n=1 Tax=Azospirillum doebereinerae TaxID=92933 RepID=UPI001EE5A587|nr:hypothetical protein [Azospirillum doebereinerae]MCG5240097.1 hypothetical protein [Azospirillum doebereinerae]
MAILTRSGRAALAAAVKARSIHLALGAGNPAWDVSHVETKAFVLVGGADVLTLANAPVSGVTVANPNAVDGDPPYSVGTDYTVNASTGAVTRVDAGSGGTIPPGATVRVTYTRARDAEDPTATALLSEVGRRPVDEVYFVTPDPAGGIVVPTGRYAVTPNTTNHLFIRVRFDFTDAADATVREQALFVGTVTDPALPPGQKYFTPGEVTDPGILLLLQHSVPIVRQNSTRETFEFVVTF